MSDDKDGKTLSADARREALIEVTAGLMMGQGVAGLRTRDVTEAAGVGAGLLNHYFRWSDLRALAWARIFEEVAAHQFGPGQAAPQMETYIDGAFAPDSAAYWRLWIEAAELSQTDEAMAEALHRAQKALHEGLRELLARGVAEGAWQIADPEASALRIGALNDGLAGLLLSKAPYLDAAAATAHLRQAFESECRLSAAV